jgi:hypothetical protein
MPLGSDTSCAPIFIVGCGRSGTTLLRLIINRHPELAIFGETGAFFRDRKYAFLSNPRALNRFIKDWRIVVEQESPYPRLMSSGSLIKSLSRAESYAATMSLIMEEFAEAEKKSVWGEKTPSHVLQLPKLFTAYPKARVIHITRDPRAVVSSASVYLDHGNFNRANIYRTACHWVRCERAIDSFIAKSPEKIALVRYEELVTRPESIVCDLCGFLGVQYDNKMLDISSTAQRYAPKTSAGGDIMSHQLGLLRNVNADSLDKWRTALSPELIALIESATAPWFERRGYQTASRQTADLSHVKAGLMTRVKRLYTESQIALINYVARISWYIRAHVFG